MSSQQPSVKVTRLTGWIKIELSRPEQMNALDRQSTKELREAIDLAAEEDSIRAVLLTGSGKAFSSGADLKSNTELTGDGKINFQKALKEQYDPIVLGLRKLPKPVVAAVNGPAAGISCSIALACDLVLAAESAYFLLAFVNIGLAPDGGASALIPARIGLTRTAELMMLGERLTASQAHKWGLVNRVVPDGQLTKEAQELVERLAQGPTKSYAAIKKELNGLLLPQLERQLDLESETQQSLGTTGDFLEGVQAFVERRKASFTGK